MIFLSSFKKKFVDWIRIALLDFSNCIYEIENCGQSCVHQPTEGSDLLCMSER